MGGHKPSPNPTLVDSYPDVYLTTGLVAENHARSFALVRIDMHRAHQMAMTAIRAVDRESDDDLRSRIACETWDHYPEHTEQIHLWLDR